MPFSKTIRFVLIPIVVSFAAAAWAAPPSKTAICHKPGKLDKILTINVRGLSGHLKHGDFVVGAEVCDGIDNDCNGVDDDGIYDLVSGTDVGECQVEIQQCIQGTFHVVQPRIDATGELCDGLDNDCNGSVDDGPIVVGECTAGFGACVVEGAIVCTDGSFACDAVSSAPPETREASCADGLDNDCDERIDDLDPDCEAGAFCDPDAAPVVEGTCSASDPECDDPFRVGTCWDRRVNLAADGTLRPWRDHQASFGCSIDPEELVEAGFEAAAANLNNPTDARVSSETEGAVRCPSAAFATFPTGAICDATRDCDPRDYGKVCGAATGRGSFVDCGRSQVPSACEQLDSCLGQCGYREFDCVEQYRRNLMAVCDALTGLEALGCYDACVEFADLYADTVGVPDPGPGVWSETDLARQQWLCECCALPEGPGLVPAVCGDGVCDANLESCHASSCPADCGTCPLGSECLIDSDCAVGGCGPEGRCAPKQAGATCRGGVDCHSGTCEGGSCQSTCGDGLCDGDEQCGAGAAGACSEDCGLCPNTVVCESEADCLSGVCSDGVCLGRFPGEPCLDPSECGGAICEQGLCLAAPLPAGAACATDPSCEGDFEGTSATFGPGGRCDLEVCVSTALPPGSACGRHGVCERTVRITDDLQFPALAVCNLGACLDSPLAVGETCDTDLACQSQVCNLGACSEGSLALGAECDSDSACGPGLACAQGACRSVAGTSCTGAADCASGLCSTRPDGTAACESACGDGICEGAGTELCGADDVRACHSDCGDCSIPATTTPLPGDAPQATTASLNTESFPGNPCENLGGTIGNLLCAIDKHYPRKLGEFCASDFVCKSKTCDLGRCVRAGSVAAGDRCASDAACATGLCDRNLCTRPGSRPEFTPCWDGAACESGLCLRGLCRRTGFLPNGFPCDLEDKEACAGGSCNQGACVESGSVSHGSGCDDPTACDGGVCNLGVCTEPESLTDGERCDDGDACRGGICDLQKCAHPGSRPLGALCAGRAACESGRCVNGQCSAPLPAGSVCINHEGCMSGICNLGRCRNPGSVDDLDRCVSDDACSSGVCGSDRLGASAFIDRPGICAPRCGDDVCSAVERCAGGNESVGDVLNALRPDLDLPTLPGQPLASLLPSFSIPTQLYEIGFRGGSPTRLRCKRDCGRCDGGDLCFVPEDCKSGRCGLGICWDLGRPDESLCSNGGMCASDVCNFGHCIAETKPFGELCSNDGACKSERCISGVCFTRCGDDACSDSEKCGDSNGESALAGGGLGSRFECNEDCGKCKNGEDCREDLDCVGTSFCTLGKCVAAGILPAGTPCSIDEACQSGVCEGFIPGIVDSGICAQECGDEICGGGLPPEHCGAVDPLACKADCGRCESGESCLFQGDCKEGLACSFLECTAPRPVGSLCSTDLACETERCLAGLCAPKAFCGDLSCNAGESCQSCALDCGLCCKATGKACATNTQCCTGKCISNPFGTDRCL